MKENSRIATPSQEKYGPISWKKQWKERVQRVLNLFLEEKGIEQSSKLAKFLKNNF